MAQQEANTLELLAEKFDGVLSNCPEAQYKEFEKFLPDLRSKCVSGVFNHGKLNILFVWLVFI